jgi:hypothetical protein
VEDHLERFLGSTESEAVGGEDEQTFVREVVAGCCQHSQLIKVVVNGYYSSAEGSSCLRADTHLYHVVCYLLLFRLSEMGVVVWRKLIHSLNIVKMYQVQTCAAIGSLSPDQFLLPPVPQLHSQR